MFKKIIQLFSKNDSPASNATSLNSVEQATKLSSELSRSAEELKEIGDQYFKSLDLAQADIYYKKSLAINSNQFEIYKNMGVAQYHQKNLEGAIKLYDQAIALKPDYPEALSNRGLALNDLKKFGEALICLNRAIGLKPDFAFAYNNRGMVLAGLNRLEEALVSYDRAIAFKPDYALAYKNRGSLLNELGRLSEASDNFERAIELDPDIKLGYGLCLEYKAIVCDWSEYESYLEQLQLKINEGKNIAHPLIVLWFLSYPELQKKMAEICTMSWFPANKIPSIFKHPKHNKIRIAYFSGEFFNHAVSFLTAELFERHDKSKFELIAFSLSAWKDEMTVRLEHTFDRFIDVSAQSDSEVALMARELEIDIAIDLGGFTGGSRTGIFAKRAAPIQVNYLGYPGTMGADYMDYIIADATIIPPSHQQYYTEKVAYLPSFQVNDTKREISDRVFTREDLGLPLEGFVFCCFNNITKINPTSFDVWMRILKQVEGSVLWLLDENPTAVNNLRKEAAARGIDGGRLVFANKLPLAEYLARYRMADLFLDTLPYNAGTTASDALWAGLPVLTQIGEAFAGRMAASLLNAIKLPELITTSQEDYERLAIKLATHPEKLEIIKEKLANNRLTTPLFDIEYFTRNIESAYTKMYEQSQAGLEPNHITTI